MRWLCRTVMTGFFTALLFGLATPAASDPGDLVGRITLDFVAPVDIAYDDTGEGSFWITSVMEYEIYHFSRDLKKRLGTVQLPFENPLFSQATGLAYNSRAQTLFVGDTLNRRIYEVRKDGSPTGRVLEPDLPNLGNGVYLKGMAFHRSGDGGDGSLFLVEDGGNVIYELTLDGEILRSFPDPDDPERFLGVGSRFRPSDVDPIYEGDEITGFYVLGFVNDSFEVLKLDRDGNFTGVSIPMTSPGGHLTGFLRRFFPHPETGEELDAYVAVMDTEARVAVLEGGEPPFQGIFNFSCSQSGATVDLTWSNPQRYDTVEILMNCEVVEALAGDATSWQGNLESEGVFHFAVRATADAETTTTQRCAAVLGPGQVLVSRPIDARNPEEIAVNDEGLVIVTDSRERRLLLHDLDFAFVGEVLLSAFFVAEGDVITAVARGNEPDTAFVFNQTRFTIGKVDFSGSLLSDFEPQLPDLDEDPDEEDRGYVHSMFFDSDGGGGSGSLWLLELQRDHIYELSLSGDVLREIAHPYLGIDPPPEDSDLGIASLGLSFVVGREGRELYIGGRALRDHGEPRFFRFDIESGEVVPGSAIPLTALGGIQGFQHVAGDGEPRLITVHRGDPPTLRVVRTEPSPVAPLTFFTCRQLDQDDEVELSFVANDTYDAIEVLRDCEKIAELPGAATDYVDSEAPPGFRDYAVRAVRGGAASDLARCSLQVGAGAILQREFTWPANDPESIARDPQDGSLYVTNAPRPDVRKVFHFSADFTYLDTRELELGTPWEISAIAIRVTPDGESLLCQILRDGPGGQGFALEMETLDGRIVDVIEISPPGREGFFVDVVGLTWDPGSDTFFYLESTSESFVQMDPQGQIVSTFAHPLPPPNHFIRSEGVWVVPERKSILTTTVSDPSDPRVTRVIELSFNGEWTGLEIPLSPRVQMRGMALVGNDLIVLNRSSGVGEFFRLNALSAPPVFIRGDADGSEEINLSDAVFLLNHLFRGGPAPSCSDAADGNDDGSLNLSDAVYALNYLFLGGAVPPEPFPDRGEDPTPDELSCAEGL